MKCRFFTVSEEDTKLAIFNTCEARNKTLTQTFGVLLCSYVSITYLFYPFTSGKSTNTATDFYLEVFS